MIETIKVELIEDKTSTSGKVYTRCKTTSGWMTCWNAKVVEGLKKQLNKPLNVEVETNEKGYKSIKSFSLAEEAITSNPTQATQSNADMPLSMLVAYSKDIFNVMQLQISEEDEVKKAEKLEYYADYSAMLLMRMKRKIENELKLEKVPEEEDEESSI